MRATVWKTDTLVIDLPAKAYRDGERIRISVDGLTDHYVDPLIPVSLSIGGVIDPSYPVYASDGRRLRAEDVRDGREYAVIVVARDGGKFVVE